MSPPGRARLRDLGISLGVYPPGPHNAITDVAGVQVGHVTLTEGTARTGVTAILPRGGDVFVDRVAGGAFILNGAGEMSGLIQVMEWGLIETPILLTNTLSVGAASKGMVDYLLERYPGIGTVHDVIIPVVGECDDSFLNDITASHVTEAHVAQAIDAASGGPVAEGSVGGGTGMLAFDLKGGIGTSSRVVPTEAGAFTLGVLVMSNLGRLEDLRIDGAPIGRALVPRFQDEEKRRFLYGSIIVVIATDAPLSAHQLQRLCKRSALGLGRVGSYAAHGSGEIAIAFSTTNRRARAHQPLIEHLAAFSDQAIDPFYRATIECTEEAVLNALCMAEPMTGASGVRVPVLPLEEVQRLMASFAAVR